MLGLLLFPRAYTWEWFFTHLHKKEKEHQLIGKTRSPFPAPNPSLKHSIHVHVPNTNGFLYSFAHFLNKHLNILIYTENQESENDFQNKPALLESSKEQTHKHVSQNMLCLTQTPVTL